MGNVAQLTLLVTSPAAFFAELKQRPSIWFPLLLVTVASVLLNVWYFQVVDFDWLRDNTITQAFASNPAIQKMPEAERAKIMEQSAKFMSRGFLMGSGIFGTMVVLPAVLAISALYFFLAGKVVKVNYPFEKWFSLTCWLSVPALLGIVASAVTLAMQSSPVQLAQTDLQALSLNELFFHRTIGQPGYLLLASLGLPTLLSQALTIIGVRVWTERSWLFSTVFALLPAVVVYGVWALRSFH